MELFRAHVLVCGGTGCSSSGSGELIRRFEEQIAKQGLDKEVKVVRTGCFGLCEAGPVVIVYPEGTFYSRIRPDDVDEIVSEHLLKGRIVQHLVYKEKSKEEHLSLDNIDFYRSQMRLALRNCGVIDPESIDEYIAFDGYKALAKVLTEMSPQQVIDEVLRSGLRGRGGAGFPTGKKWQFAAASQAEQKYMVCNADEGDPGAFMDRSVLEGDPHAVLEAMAIGGYAIGASEGYIYVRAEYPIAVKRLQIAIEQAREYGLLGKNIFDSGFDFDVYIRLGAGAFVCGCGFAGCDALGCLTSPPTSTTSKPWPTFPRSSSRAPTGSPPSVPKTARAPRSSPWAEKSTTPAWSKFPWARRCARSSTISAAVFRVAKNSRPYRPAGLPAAAFPPSSWTSPSTTIP